MPGPTSSPTSSPASSPTSGPLQPPRPGNLAVRGSGRLRHRGVLLLAVIAACAAMYALGYLPRSGGILGGSLGGRSASFIDAVIHIAHRADSSDAIHPTVYGTAGFFAFLVIIGLLRVFDLLIGRLRGEPPFAAAPRPMSLHEPGLPSSGGCEHTLKTCVPSPAQLRYQARLPGPGESSSKERPGTSDSAGNVDRPAALLDPPAMSAPAPSHELRHPELLEVQAIAVTLDARARLRPHFFGIRRRSGEHRLSREYAGPYRRATDRPAAPSSTTATSSGSEDRGASCLDLEAWAFGAVQASAPLRSETTSDRQD